MGVGNDLLSKVASCKRILGPATDAFDCYDEIKRDRAHLGKDAKLFFFEFLNKETPSFKQGEPIKFHIKWRCNTPSSKYKLLIPIKSDGGITLGTALSNLLDKSNAAGEYDEFFELDTRGIVDGDYSFVLAMYGVDEHGNETMCDHSIIKLWFTIEKDKSSVMWSKSFWGNMRFSIKGGG